MSYDLRQRDGRWYLQGWHQGRRVRLSTGTSTRAEADRRARQMWAELTGSGDADMTLQEAVETTVAVRWRGTRGEATAHANALTACQFLGSDRAVAELTTRDIDRYAMWLSEQGLSGATVNRKLAALSTVLRVAHDRGHIDKLPKFTRRRESAGRLRWLTREEEVAVWRHLEPDMRDLCTVLVDTGMRLGEAWRLEARDIDLVHSRVHVWETKADKPRTIPLTQRARGILERRAEAAHGPVFDTICRKTAIRRWRRACRAAGIDDNELVIHSLRHTCASRLVQAGVEIKVVQEWMGHRSIQTTLRYAHLAPANLEAARDRLEGGATVIDMSDRLRLRGQ